jgi:hypothetical protein
MSMDFSFRADPAFALTPRAHAADRQRRQFAILGFVMGFATSAAIGAVLYLYLTVG